MNLILATFGNMGSMLVQPRRTSCRLAATLDLRPAAALVLGYGILAALGSYVSYVQGAYPGQPGELALWVEAWGEFGILPFVKIPPEHYRLFMAIILLPLLLAAWMLMAGTARLLAIVFGGRVSYDQYLSLFAFSTFPLWLLASILDGAYQVLLQPSLGPALRGELSPSVNALILNFEPVMYVVLFGLAGVYNALATHCAESQPSRPYAAWKSALSGLLTFAWPTLLSATLLR